MKKLTILICVLAILLALTGIASASKPEEQTFWITGYTDLNSYWYETLPSGLTKFHLTALGAVSGYFTGTFTFDESGIVDFDPTTGQGSGRGTNHGIMTITALDDDSELAGEVVIRFGGRTDSQDVWGNFTVLRGTGAYEHLHGMGKYTGNAGLVFTVEFTGRFHTDPQ